MTWHVECSNTENVSIKGWVDILKIESVCPIYVLCTPLLALFLSPNSQADKVIYFKSIQLVSGLSCALCVFQYYSMAFSSMGSRSGWLAFFPPRFLGSHPASALHPCHHDFFSFLPQAKPVCVSGSFVNLKCSFYSWSSSCFLSHFLAFPQRGYSWPSALKCLALLFCQIACSLLSQHPS